MALLIVSMSVAAAALAQTRSINLRDEAPFGGQQPIEGFLGRPIPELARPKQ